MGKKTKGLRLSARHRRELLVESGISEDVVRARGYRTVTKESELAELGFKSYQRRVPGYLIPMYDQTGKVVNHQFKPDEPRKDKRGRPVKYETPAGTHIVVDCPPGAVEQLRDPSVRVVITEGVKKADAAVSAGHCAIALQGVDCWQRDYEPLAFWSQVPWKDREVVIIYDSDATTKDRVRNAREELADHLRDLGADVQTPDLPAGTDASGKRVKVGLDDYIVVGGTIPALLGEDQPVLDKHYEQALQRMRSSRRAAATIRQEEATAAFREPPSDRSLKEMLAKERVDLPYTLADLHPTGSNALITAQFKAGKTTLMLNLARSYADGDAFLGSFGMLAGPGNIAYWNYELTEAQFIDYVEHMGVDNPDRICPLNLRGHRLDLFSDHVFGWAVDWLQSHNCDALIVDPYGAAAMLTDENSNSEARAFLHRLDELKAAAGIRDLWMPAHTGRGEREEGQEHVRGATVVDDWADVRWTYTAQAANGEDGRIWYPRYLRAMGRGVEISEREVHYDKEDGGLFVAAFRSRAKARAEDGALAAVRAVAAEPGINSTALRQAMTGDTKVKNDGLKTALDKGWLTAETGAKGARLHYVTEAGQAAIGAL
jgi:hypothetical protein